MKIGLALGGGGAKGFAHLGVLEALSDAGIEFDVVAGTSIGALIGAVYVSGNIDNLKNFATNISMTDLPFMLGPTWPKGGLFSGNYVEELVDKFVSIQNIEDLAKPFAAVTVDLNKAEVITFTKGDLKRAIRASTSIPGVFKPVFYEDKILVDGGVLESVPLDAVRSLGADFIVAVDLLSDISGNQNFDQGKPSIIEIVQRSSIVAQRKITEYKFKEDPPNVVLRPPLSQVGVMDFHNGRPIYEIGRKTAQEILPELIQKIQEVKRA